MAKGKWPKRIDCPRMKTERLQRAKEIIDLTGIREIEVPAIYPSSSLYQNGPWNDGFVELMMGVKDDELLGLKEANYGENDAAEYCGFLEASADSLQREASQVRNAAETNKTFVSLMGFELERRKRQKEYDPSKLPPVIGAYVCGDYGSETGETFKIPLRRISTGAPVCSSSWTPPAVDIPEPYRSWFMGKLKEAKIKVECKRSIPRNSNTCRMGLELGFKLNHESMYVSFPSGVHRWIKFTDLALRQEHK